MTTQDIDRGWNAIKREVEKAQGQIVARRYILCAVFVVSGIFRNAHAIVRCARQNANGNNLTLCLFHFALDGGSHDQYLGPSYDPRHDVNPEARTRQVNILLAIGRGTKQRIAALYRGIGT